MSDKVFNMGALAIVVVLQIIMYWDLHRTRKMRQDEAKTRLEKWAEEASAEYQADQREDDGWFYKGK